MSYKTSWRDQALYTRFFYRAFPFPDATRYRQTMRIYEYYIIDESSKVTDPDLFIFFNTILY